MGVAEFRSAAGSTARIATGHDAGKVKTVRATGRKRAVKRRSACNVAHEKLNYVSDSCRGISRRKLRGRFAYSLPDGTRLKDPEEIRQEA